MAKQNEAGTQAAEAQPPKLPKREPAGPPPAPPRGIVSSVNRKAIHGPDGPSQAPATARAWLVKRLKLTDPSDRELFEAAARQIAESDEQHEDFKKLREKFESGR